MLYEVITEAGTNAALIGLQGALELIDGLLVLLGLEQLFGLFTIKMSDGGDHLIPQLALAALGHRDGLVPLSHLLVDIDEQVGRRLFMFRIFNQLGQYAFGLV